jgi:hypothetical protein
MILSRLMYSFVYEVRTLDFTVKLSHFDDIQLAVQEKKMITRAFDDRLES